jgi:hypothetical protein
MSDLICKSKAAALSALDTIIDNMSAGTEKDAIAAVRRWIAENVAPGLDEETKESLRKIFEGTPEQRAGRAWLDREMSDPAYRGHGSDHHEFIHEPEDGAELECHYSTEYKKWIPIGYGRPPVLHKTGGVPGEEE